MKQIENILSEKGNWNTWILGRNISCCCCFRLWMELNPLSLIQAGLERQREFNYTEIVSSCISKLCNFWHFLCFFLILQSNAECSFVYSISSLFPETSQFWFGFDFSLMQCQIVFSCISLVLLECSCWHYLVGATMDAPIILTRHLRTTHYALSMPFSTMPCQWHSQCMECRKHFECN